MIVQFLVDTILNVLTFVFSIVPNIPPLPSFVEDGLGYFNDMIGDVVGLFSYLYTPVIFIFAMTAVVVVLNFHHVYHLIMFIVRKLPIGAK